VRDARGGGGPKPKKPDKPKLTHRQQQIVHYARELVQAPRHSGVHKSAAQALADLKLNDHEHRLANRAAQQHREHLDRLKRLPYDSPQRERLRRQEQASLTSPENIERLTRSVPGFHPLGDTAHAVNELPSIFGSGGRLSDIPHNIRHPGGDSRIEFNRPLTTTEFERFQRTGVPPLDAIKAKHTRALDAPFLPGNLIGRGLSEARAAARSTTKANKALRDFRKSREGKQAVADLREHPVRAEVHRQLEATPELKPRERDALKKHFDREVHEAALKSGKTVPELLDHPAVRKALEEEGFVKGPTTEEAAAAVTKGLKGAPKTTRETEALRSSERGVRAGLAEEAMRGVTGLEEKIAAAKTELQGALPKLEHQGLRALSEREVNLVTDMIESHPDLQFYQRLHAMDALRNAWLHGASPTKGDYALLKKALGPQITREMLKPARIKAYKHAAYEVLNIPRSLMSSFDVSAPFRQGLVAFARHPLLTAKNLKPMMEYWRSEHGYQDLMRSIDARPNREIYAKSGLAITDVEHALNAREEQFMSNYAEALRIKFGTKATGEQRYLGPGNVVRRSGRAYTGFLVKTRADMFDHLLDVAANLGHDVENEKFLKDLAGYVNAATGRGNLVGSFEKHATFLNSVFFSPRLMASRLTFLNPVSYVRLDPFVRQQKLRAAFQLAGGIGAVLWLGKMAGAEVGIDPFNADFGKLKFGDTRYDITGGFAGYVRMLGVLGMASTGHDPERKAQDALTRFFRGKFSPTTQFGTEVALHTDYSGYRAPNFPIEVRNLFIPLIVQDAMKVQENKAPLSNVLESAAASAVGIGVNTYKTEPKAAASPDNDAGAWAEKYQQVYGEHPPMWLAQAREDKDTYEQALADFKKEHNITKSTKRQQFDVKLEVLAQRDPAAAEDLRRMYEGLTDDEWMNDANADVESALNWEDVNDYTREMNDSGK